MAYQTGQVALVAQSGAFCTALLDWADSSGFGFSAVASLGATADVGFGDVLDYLAVDPETKSILLYIEGVSDARSFMSGLRVAARLKPVIVVKSGRNESGTRAAVSHTGALIGGDEVFDAAIQRAGAVRVTTVNQLFAAAQTLASGTRVEGPRLAIVTNGGGPGVMAADRASDLNVPLAELSPNTIDKLSAVLPTHWSHSDPVDILGDADSERYRAATEIVLADKNVDGLLVLLTPQAMTDPTACAEGVIAAAKEVNKPVLACWMGANLVKEGRQRFAEAGIPQFSSPEAGVDAFGYLACYRRNQKALLQAPAPLSKHTRTGRGGCAPDHRTCHGRTPLHAQQRRGQGDIEGVSHPDLAQHQRQLGGRRPDRGRGRGAAGRHENQFSGYHAQIGCGRCTPQYP